MKIKVCHLDVVVWAYLKGLRAKLVLAARKEFIPTAVVDGDGFRKLSQMREMEMH
jgi:hypothetical protein